jgi:hypothetical protein
MNENHNPFEQALRAVPTSEDPFAPPQTHPFGGLPQPETPAAQNAPAPLSLGSQPDAQNPFDNPAAFAAAPPTTAPQIPQTPQPQMPPLQSSEPFTPPTAPPVSEQAASAPFAPPPAQPAAPAEKPGAEQMALFPTEKPPADNPIEAALDKKDSAGQASIFAKPPIFEHGAVKEPIEDLNQTFDELRIAKADDFPELEDAIRVSWDITYGKIRKTVPTPKKTKIGEYKRQIESSKEFLDALKKDKDKSPDCCSRSYKM